MAKNQTTSFKPDETALQEISKKLEESNRALAEKSAAYDALLRVSQSEGERLTNLETDLKTLEAINEELHESKGKLAEQLDNLETEFLKLKGQSSCIPMEGHSAKQLPLEFRAVVLSSALAALRDRMTDMPMTEKEFEAYADQFVNQAHRLTEKIIDRLVRD